MLIQSPTIAASSQQYMDWAFVHRIWEKWASNSVGSPGKKTDDRVSLHSPSLYLPFYVYLIFFKHICILIEVLLIQLLGLPLKAALLINYDPTGPSRLLSTM